MHDRSAKLTGWRERTDFLMGDEAAVHRAPPSHWMDSATPFPFHTADNLPLRQSRRPAPTQLARLCKGKGLALALRVSGPGHRVHTQRGGAAWRRDRCYMLNVPHWNVDQPSR